MDPQRVNGRLYTVARPPSRSLVLRLYGRLVPLPVRLSVRERMSPQVRARLARRLTRAGGLARTRDGIAAVALRARYRGRGSATDAMIVRVPAGMFFARVAAVPSPWLARRQTLDFVLDVLRRAEIPAFRVRGYDDWSSAVGVPASYRPAVATALARAGRTVPCYVARTVANRIGDLRPAASDLTWRRLGDAPVVRLVQFLADPSGAMVLGAQHGCDIEFWTASAGELHAPRPNRVADTVPDDGVMVLAEESAFVRCVVPGDSTKSPTRPEFLGTLLDDITFPIDAVYTWVDGSDPAWRARRDEARRRVTGEINEFAANEARYTSRDELRYSLRSLEQFAPWVNHIWLVTDDQVPLWLDPDHERITVISHRELFAGRGLLPTFNSHAIETQLHRIPGLTEHFLYFNDDVLLGRPVSPQLFFHSNGVTKFFPSTAKIDPSLPSIADAPVTAAGKNNRRLVAEAFDRRVSYKMKHCPHPLRRSLLEEISVRYAAELDATSRHQFRHPGDVSLPSALYQYWAHITGRAVTDNIRYMYTNIADPDSAHRLRLTLARRDFDVMCLNDTDSDPDALAEHQMLTEFLSMYFPVPAAWERG